jgi:hypothetical protein
VRIIVALRGDWLSLRQVGAFKPVDIAARKQIESIEDLVLGRIPHGPLDPDKVAGVLAPAVWTGPVKIVNHLTL